MADKRFALLIASYQYEDPDLRQLISPPQDVEALESVLRDSAIGGFRVQTVLNKPSHEIRQTIETFFKDRKRDDLSLLYFSGHGIKDWDGMLYFATSDTRRQILRSTAIDSVFINDVMSSSRSRQQVLLLDCCYSGAFAKGMSAKADPSISIGEFFKCKGRVVLTASSALQYAFEGNKIRDFEESKAKKEDVQSIFTHHLVHGLMSGEADLDGDGRISIDELYDYVDECVMKYTSHQRPQKWAFAVEGKIIIAFRPVLPEPEPPPELYPSLKCFLSVTQKYVNVGDKVEWTLKVCNDGDADLRHVHVYRGKSLRDKPFDLAIGKERSFTFPSTYRTKGKKEVKITVTGIASNGEIVKSESNESVSVFLRPSSAPGPEFKSGSPEGLLQCPLCHREVEAKNLRHHLASEHIKKSDYRSFVEDDKKKILVVDDEESIHLLYREELEAEGYKVYSAMNGEEALKKVDTVQPDLVVLDVKMPGMDGIEVLARIKKKHSSLPVILHTAYPEYKQELKAWASDDYIVKSFNPHELMDSIKKHLNR